MTSVLLWAFVLLQATTNQTDWSGGPGVTGPVTDFGRSFIRSDSVVYSSAGHIITMAQAHARITNWTKHIVENNDHIDGHGALRPADFDGDGDYDLAGAIDGLNVIRIYRNRLVETGDPAFVYQVDLPVDVRKWCLTWVGDFNNDGRPDIVVPGDSTFWFENNGNWSFTKRFIGYVDHRGDTNFLDVGDVDNDGDMDVVCGMRPVVLWRNNGNGTFARESIYTGRMYRAKLGDLNGDGYLDLLQADWVFLNRGPGHPTVFPTTPSWQAGFRSGEVDGIWISDFDSDRDLDLLICRVWCTSVNRAIYWYENDGTGVNYTRHTICTGSTALANGDAAIAEDMDLDGYVDVVGGYSRIGYFHQYPTNTFTLVQVDPSFGGSGGCHWVEVQNLCKQPGATKTSMDIIASGTDQFAWWENGLDTNFSRNSWLVSSVLDAGVPSYWRWLKWDAMRPAGGELDFYVRSGVTAAQCTLSIWRGPLSVSTTQGIDSVNITSHTGVGDRYFQYRVFMAGFNDSRPNRPAVLYDVWVTHEPVPRDVGVVAITSPAGAAPPGMMIPAALLRNYGVLREPVRVFFEVSSSPAYRDSLLLPAGLPFADTMVTFDGWAATAGSYQARCSTWMATDEVASNNVVRQDFTVNNIDVGVVRIAGPWGTIDTQTVSPAAVVRNFGTNPASFRTWFVIGAAGVVYHESIDVIALASGDSALVQFPAWSQPYPEGQHWTRCSTGLDMDANHGNDVAIGGFTVVVLKGRWGWVERALLPAGPSGKAVKDGGWLAHDLGTGLVFAAKGNKTADFYVYHPAEDSWQTLTSWPDGREMRKPGKGAVGCVDGAGRIYAIKGNSTQGFWMYDAEGDSWSQKADVPLGPSGKKVKGGTDIVYCDSFVYLLKGVKTDFLRYDVADDTWTELPPAPVGATGKPRYDKGSWLVTDEAGTIYLHKAKYHELFAYDVAADSWRTQLKGMRFLGRMGRTKKAKDGSSGAWLNDSLYALKGGNTQEFWQYRPQDDSWNELDTMPQMGSYAKKRKRVKNGADLTASGTGVLYALKGNKTTEFWKYTPYPAVARTAPAIGRDGVIAAVAPLTTYRLAVFPNPTRSGFATVSLSGLADQWPGGPVTVGVYDASGRLVLQPQVGNRRSQIPLDLRSLRAGVYVVRLTAGRAGATQKLVLQR